jgi:hypothetical protein
VLDQNFVRLLTEPYTQQIEIKEVMKNGLAFPFSFWLLCFLKKIELWLDTLSFTSPMES